MFRRVRTSAAIPPLEPDPAPTGPDPALPEAAVPTPLPPPEAPIPAAPSAHRGLGWILAFVGAAAFGAAGSFATPLIQAGWSPGAAVTARVGIAAVLLAAPALWILRGRWQLLRRNLRSILSYGVLAVAGCQLFYFSALETLTVGVALLLEYTGIVMVVGFLWLRHGQRPGRLTLIGAVVAVGGLVLVLDVVGGGAHVTPIGVMWALLAAVGLAVHFIVSAGSDPQLPPLVLAAGGLLVGAVILLAAGATGLLPMEVSFTTVEMVGTRVPWWVPLGGVAVISAALAYVTAIGGVRILGATLGSFVSLAEVLFAVVFAWLLLGQVPALIQLLGGALVVGGVALVKADEV